MSVSVQHLTKIYGSQRAVDDISFTARPGEVLGFLGPNGAGKTTTMKMITGYLPPDAGEITVCGINVEEDPLGVQRQVGYLPEHNPLYQDMYVREFLTFVARLHKLTRPKARIDELIEQTGLTREQHKPISALSKGYRQRVGLAQALLHDPAVLILDEPTAGLDPNQLAEIRALIQQLGQEKTVILSTHIMQEVQALCRRVVIINQGQLEANDPIEQLQARLRGDTIITVGFQEKTSAADLKKIEGVNKVEALADGRWHLFTAARQDIRPRVFRFAVDRQLTLLELHQETASVEDVFRQLTHAGQ
jgi:ABC-2 type transport system ATP-binding protein